MIKYLILFLLSSCTTDAPHLFQVSGFSERQNISIENAAHEWCVKSSDRYCPQIVENIEHLDTSIIEFVNTLEGTSDDIATTTVYPCHDVPLSSNNCLYRIQIRNVCADWGTTEQLCLEDIRRIVLHEFGHTFGKGEDTEKGNVMYQWMNGQSLHLTEKDVR